MNPHVDKSAMLKSAKNNLADTAYSWQADSASRRAVCVVQRQKQRMGRGFTRMKRIDADEIALEIALEIRVYPPNPRKSASYSSLRSHRPRQRVEKFTMPEVAKKQLADMADMAD